jgi:hypothetical protein
MIPRGIAPARTSGAVGPCTRIPPAAPIGPPPGGRTTGSSAAPCCPTPDQPAWLLPLAGRRYFRRAQLSYRQGRCGPRETFRTKCERAVELLRRPARAVAGKHRAIFDGAFAVRRVVRPLVVPEAGQSRIDLRTRLRHDARRHRLRPAERKPGQRGPTPRWGPRLPPPRQGGRWPGAGQEGPAFVDGRVRAVRSKEGVCRGRVLGHQVPVKAVVAQVEGDRKRFTLVSSATDLSGLPVGELFAARFRPEDGLRDLKQRRGWEACRAWTTNPIIRTTQAWFVTMRRMRRRQFHWEAAGETAWWRRPPWDQRRSRPRVREGERLLRSQREGMQRLRAAGREEERKEGSRPAGERAR